MSDNKILELLKLNDNVYDILCEQNDEEILLQLSPMRANLIEWFDFKESASVLEIGAECGTITQLLCSRDLKVTAVESGIKYLEVNKYRNNSYTNLNLYGSLDKVLGYGEKYDYILLLGLDSYRYLSRIKDFSSFLAENGKIIIACDNKYGLSNFALTPSNDAKIEKSILIDNLKQAGFKDFEFFYPMPNYKLPSEIYSAEYIKERKSIKSRIPVYSDNVVEGFDEDLLFNQLCKTGAVDEFVNSFIIVAS